MHIRKIVLLASLAAISACQSAKVEESITTSSTAGAGPAGQQGSEVGDQNDERLIASAGASQAGSTAAVIQAYVPPQTGTVFTWRNNWSSLPPVVSYRVSGVVTVGETEYVKFTSVAGMKNTVHAYYDTGSFALKGYRDGDDRALVTYKPVEERYRFPMKAGDQWVTAWRSLDHKEERETKGGGVVKVVAIETVKLPAGEFRAAKVQLPLPRDAAPGMRHLVWFAPDLGITVKEQITSGSMNWTQILEKIEKPVS